MKPPKKTVTSEFDLSRLEPRAFEYLATELAIRVLGNGVTTFGPGADGGRDGFFEGEATYPSAATRWRGTWYLQAKFHAPHLSKDPQKWLLERIAEELAQFKSKHTKRVWPDNWIVITNVQVSASPKNGTHDAAVALVGDARKKLAGNFHIWGARKVYTLLRTYPDVAHEHLHLISAGDVLAELHHAASGYRRHLDRVRHALIFNELMRANRLRLDEAGSDPDSPPPLYDVFTDLSFGDADGRAYSSISSEIAGVLDRNLSNKLQAQVSDKWLHWAAAPCRSPLWLIRGSPGHGKSTIGRLMAQIHRCALAQRSGAELEPPMKEVIRRTEARARGLGVWPRRARLPLVVELKDYAKWLARRGPHEPIGVLSFAAGPISVAADSTCTSDVLRELLSAAPWLLVLDGLDEVPDDIRGKVAEQIEALRRDMLGSDLFVICTSRPQGYKGDLDAIPNIAHIHLLPLTPSQALECSDRLVRATRSESEAVRAAEVLKEAIQTDAVAQLMTTPLQCHIMAVIVRNGARPPSRKWTLFSRFYHVVQNREADRGLADSAVAAVLHNDHGLVKVVHNYVGMTLHARAETKQGAQSRMPRESLARLIHGIAGARVSTGSEQIANALLKATTERLVLISTPDDGQTVRFDVRLVQEFFAAEYVLEELHPDLVEPLLEAIVGDAHWREVLHFLLSGMIELRRRRELFAAISVLRHVDERDDMGDRALRRQIGGGARACAQLLIDGVLETDRSMRDYFRDLLTPLASLEVAAVHRELSAMKHLESRAWVRSIMKEFLSDGRQPGAAFLWWNLAEPHELGGCIDELRVQPSLMRLVWRFARPDEPAEERELMVRVLGDQDLNFALQGFGAVWNSGEVRHAVIDLLVEKYGGVAKAILADVMELGRPRENLRKKDLAKVGLMTFYEVEPEKLRRKRIGLDSKLPPLLMLLGRLANLLTHWSIEEWRAVSAQLMALDSWKENLPINLRRELRLDGISTTELSRASIDESEIDAGSRRRRNRASQMISLAMPGYGDSGAEDPESMFEELLQVMQTKPALGLRAWGFALAGLSVLGHRNQGAAERMLDPKLAGAIVPHLRAEPEYLALIPIERFGEFMSFVGEAEVDEFRKALVDVHSRLKLSLDSIPRVKAGSTPLPALRLPDEAPLLIPCFRSALGRTEPKAAFLGGFCAAVELDTLVWEENQSMDVRLSALGLLLLHPDSSLAGLGTLKSKLSASVWRDERLPSLLGRSLMLRAWHGAPIARELVAIALERASQRGDDWERTVAIWRETSSSPLTTRGQELGLDLVASD